ncbi:hypothetical protein IVA98_22795 [Bradyrhizobium sp. 160]|uniref:hypothetical protein n=1 Tax=unclassified Bradyrhizobium TaxID=2631580 RepID=UPI001FFB8BD1|nr:MULTISPECIES: hypothetical protein [unclassified Bradyrhizobium]MCK1546750.1 hypothetical protein [Bradyrhizobium sp. 179]MCK1625940.1 hypothetical protein [Bradyrhizobium sp. 160]
MDVRLDAIIAEIARTLDASLLMHDPEFANLPRSQRMHLITRCLAARGIARGEKYGGRKVRKWRPSSQLGSSFGVKDHGIPDEVEHIEAPVAMSTLVDGFSDLLQTNHEPINQVTDYVLRLFGLHALGLLQYRGKDDGFCQFDRSEKRIDVVDEAGNTMDFVDKYLA